MPALERVSTVDALVAELRRRVLDGDLPPGSKLREVELSRHYGVGRYSLRGALRVLTDEGLLRHEAHRGVYVPAIDRDGVEDLFVLRRALEVEAVRRVTQMSASLDAVTQVVERLEAHTTATPWHRVTSDDLAFHTTLVRTARSDRLERAFMPLAAQLQLVMAQARREYADPATAGRQHRVILDALATRDAAVAERAIRAHLEDGAESLLASLDDGTNAGSA